MTEPRRLRGRILTALAVVVAAFAVFDVPSAFAVARGAPWWLALAIGVVAFPLAPVAWHVLGERNRRRERAAAKVPPKSSTTGWDRLALRAGAVGLVAIVGLSLLAGGQVLFALRHHALWFVPRATPTLSDDSALVELVPPQARAVVWVRPTDEIRAELARRAPSAAPSETVIAASSLGALPDLAVITRGDADLVDPLSILRGKPAPWKPPGVDPEKKTTSGGLVWRASPAWKAAIGTGAPHALLAHVRGLPVDTFAVLVAQPDDAQVAGVLAYLRLHAGRLELAVDVEAKDLAAAGKLAGEARREVSGAGARWAAHARVCLAEHGGDVTVWPEGTLVRLRASLPLAQARPLADCL